MAVFKVKASFLLSNLEIAKIFNFRFGESAADLCELRGHAVLLLAVLRLAHGVLLQYNLRPPLFAFQLLLCVIIQVQEMSQWGMYEYIRR